MPKQRKQIESFIAADDFPPNTSDEFRALYYFIVAIQINEPKLTARVTEWYKRKNWDKSLEAGEALEKLYKEVNPRTPEDSIFLLVRCMNLLLNQYAKFELQEWQTVTYGSLRQRVAVIRRVLPPN